MASNPYGEAFAAAMEAGKGIEEANKAGAQAAEIAKAEALSQQGSISPGTTVIDGSQVDQTIDNLNTVANNADKNIKNLQSFMDNTDKNSEEYRQLEEAKAKAEAAAETARLMAEKMEQIRNTVEGFDSTVQEMIIQVSADQLFVGATYNNGTDKPAFYGYDLSKTEQWRRAQEEGLVGNREKDEYSAYGIDDAIGVNNKPEISFVDTSDWSIASSYNALNGKDRNGNESENMDAFVSFLFAMGNNKDYEFRNGVTIADIQKYMKDNTSALGGFELDGAGLMAICAAESTGGGKSSNLFGSVDSLGSENKEASRELAISTLKDMGYNDSEINSMLSESYGASGVSAYEQAAQVFAYMYNSTVMGYNPSSTYGSININWMRRKANEWRQDYNNQ